MYKNNISDLLVTTLSPRVKRKLQQENNVIVVSHLDDILKEKGIDYQTLGWLTGLRGTTISEIARCKKSSINLSHIVMIMKALNITDITKIVDIKFI